MDDGIFPATPGMVRAVRETVELLRQAGHQVSLYLMLFCLFVYILTLFSGGGVVSPRTEDYQPPLGNFCTGGPGVLLQEDHGWGVGGPEHEVHSAQVSQNIAMGI